MCMQKKDNVTSLNGDLVVSKHFYCKEDIQISGNLYIIDDASFYAGNVEADNIYIICDEDHIPTVDALSFRVHGSIISNCFDEISVNEIISIDGPVILYNEFYAR